MESSISNVSIISLMHTTRMRIWQFALSGFALLCGCASIGPPTVERDRFDYTAAISESWKRETVANLVRLRYGEAPVMLDVTSVITSYSLASNAQASAQFGKDIGNMMSFSSVGASLQYADRPTITYAPVAGERFARQMMQPFPLTAVLALLQEGYQADWVLRLCVASINGIRNDFRPLQAGDPRFLKISLLLRELQSASGLSFRRQNTGGAEIFVMDLGQANDSTARELRALLGIDPKARELTVAFGSVHEANTEITILSRSMTQLMMDLSAHIQVPTSDVAEGRTYQPQSTPEQERLFPPPLAVRSGSAPPEDAHVAVPYRGRWFWIDDRDVQSKNLLGFLRVLSSLTETAGSSAGAPVVTVPVR